MINRTSIVHRIAIMNLRCVEQIWCIGSLMNLSCMNKYHGSCNYHELEMHWTRWHWQVSFIESLITRHLNVGNCDAYERNVNIIVIYLTKSSNVFASYYLEEINKSTKTKALLCSWFIVFNDGIKSSRTTMIYLYKSCENINMKFENDREVSSTTMTHTHTCNWKHTATSTYIPT